MGFRITHLCRVEVPDGGGNTARVLRLGTQSVSLGRIFRVFWSKYQTNQFEALHLAAAGGHLGVVHALLSRQVKLTEGRRLKRRSMDFGH